MKRPLAMTVCTEKTTQIHCEHNFLFSDAAVAVLRGLEVRVALFCDEQVFNLWGKKFEIFLCEKGVSTKVFTIPPGEKQKTRETKKHLEDLLFAEKFGKDSAFVALGGGVVTDIVGFLAATFCRGVSLINIPTTLLGMVDASIGGKTGVDTPFGKNLVGAFYPADHIIIDPGLLHTLPQKEWANGLAEIIKYALIHSSVLFKELYEFKCEDFLRIEKIIAESIAIKTKVVEEDFEEKLGKRRILNFGHTIAHAIELIEDYHISHGQAVIIGLLVESYLSAKLKHLSEKAFDQIISLVDTLPFDLQLLSPRVTQERMQNAFSMDKKAVKNTPRFVLLEDIGSCCAFGGEYCTVVPPNYLKEAIEWMIKRFSGDKK